jgi:hypothetical protein
MTTVASFYGDELNRLQQKQQNATSILSSNQRIALLNDSYRKRYAKYVEILIVLVLTFIIYLGVSSLQTAFPAIPQIFVDAVAAILIAAVLIYLSFAFYELYSRSVLNYDELDLPAYDASGGIDANAIAKSGQVLPPSTDTCVGQACCPDTYTWDSTINKCKNGFTTLELTPIQNAHINTKFDSPDLKRAPRAENVAAIVDGTSLTFSKI